MSGTQAAFAESTRRSLKKILHHYMEENGYKYIHKLSQFVTFLNSRKNSWIDLIPRNVRNSDFLSILYSKPLQEYKKAKFVIGHKIRISRHDLLFRKCFKPEFTQQVSEIVSTSSKNDPTNTIKDEQDEIIRGKFYQKELITVI